MPSEERRPSRRARGKTKRWTDEQLDKLSEVGPSDVESSRDRWRQVNDGFGDLLDAEPEEEA